MLIRLQEKKVLVKRKELERKVLEGNVTCKERKLKEHHRLIMPP